MNAAQKIAAFVAGLLVVFAAAFWVGKALGPEGGADVQGAPVHHAGVVRTAAFTVSVSEGEAR